jgi:hypothetical protein
MQAEGYWVGGGHSPSTIDVTATSHVRYLCEHHREFGFSQEQIEETYRRHGERTDQEGKARDELIKIATTRGWIRIRHYTNPRDYWSIQFDKIELRKAGVALFVNSAIKQRRMSETDEIELTGFHGGYKRTYTFQEGGASQFLEEQSRSPK